jgi:cysteine desulfurase
MLYLDYAASTPIRPVALKSLETSMRDNFANPSSAHKLGKELHKKIETCRKKFLEFLGAPANGGFIFTSSATESNNTIIYGLNLKAGDAVIISLADHPSITAPVAQLQSNGIQLKEMPLLKNGTPDEEGLEQLLDDNTKLLVLTHVNNQSGAITDIKNLSLRIKEQAPHIHIHVDDAQGFGKIPVNLKESAIDSLSISAHKIGGPKGIAGLYLGPKVNVSPLLNGGGQENGLRSSTQAAPLIFSFYEAVKEAIDTLNQNLDYVTDIYNGTRQILKSNIDRISFPFAEESSPYILTFLLPGISSDIILRHLEQKDIIVSSTSACASKIKGKSPVFSALHLPENMHKFVLRASFSQDTIQEEIEIFCQALSGIYNDLKRFMR